MKRHRTLYNSFSTPVFPFLPAASAVIAVTVYLSVCPSQVGSSAKTAEQIERVIGTEASLNLSYTVLEGNSGISKNNHASL